MERHMPEPESAKPSGGESEKWVQEIADRREEAVQSVLRNFAISRQFLNAGSLSDSERLIRFYEGIAMALERTPTKEAFEEAESAFKAALRYGDSPQPATESVPGLPSSQTEGSREQSDTEALRHQAEYNLAVLYHRRAVQLRDEENSTSTSQERPGREVVSHDVVEIIEKPEGSGAGARQTKTVRHLTVREFVRSAEESSDEEEKSCEFFIDRAKTLYVNVIRVLNQGISADRSEVPAGLKPWDRVDLATYLSASVGKIVLFVESAERGGKWDESWGAPSEDEALSETEQLVGDVLRSYPGKKRHSKLKSFATMALPGWLHRLFYEMPPDQPSDLPEADESARILQNMLGQMSLARKRIAELRSGPARPAS